MKWGYTIWICGWVLLLAGVVGVVVSLVIRDYSLIAKFSASFILSFIWLKWGSSKIRRAVQVKNGTDVPNR